MIAEFLISKALLTLWIILAKNSPIKGKPPSHLRTMLNKVMIIAKPKVTPIAQKTPPKNFSKNKLL